TYHCPTVQYMLSSISISSSPCQFLFRMTICPLFKDTSTVISLTLIMLLQTTLSSILIVVILLLITLVICISTSSVRYVLLLYYDHLICTKDLVILQLFFRD